jgi:hypothetical protein
MRNVNILHWMIEKESARRPSPTVVGRSELVATSPTDEELRRSFAVAPTIRSVADHDGVVLLDIRKGQMLGMDPVGREIWQGIQRGQQIREIVDHICRLTNATPDAVGQDVVVFTQELLAQGLVVEIRR